MKIHSQHIEALKQQEQAKSKETAEKGRFEALLAKEVGAGVSTASSAPLAPPPGARALGVGSLLAAEQVAATQPSTEAEQEIMNNIESVLTQWESYAQTLAEPQSSQALRQAYGVLETISSEVSMLKERMPQLGAAETNLQTMVDELEILAVTEQVKFNRGDYL